MVTLHTRLPTLPVCLRTADPASNEAYDHQIRGFASQIQKWLSTDASPIGGDDALLDDLELPLYSIPYLLILRCEIRHAQSKDGSSLPQSILPGARLWPKLVRIVRDFDPIQIRYVGKEWRELVELVGEAAQASSKPFLAVPLVREAILRLDPSAATFTSNHLLFSKLCLYSKAYSHALPVLDKYICGFPWSTEQAHLEHDRTLPCAEHESSTAFITGDSGLSAKLTHRDYQQYFLYGGMIYMAVKEWDKALHFLNIVISSPVVNSVSLIMVEAYKKWILASLLRNGELNDPVTLTVHVKRVYQSLTKPYIALANTFKLGNLQRLNGEVEAAKSVWNADNNAGLVVQVVEAFHRHRLFRLGRSFAALTTADVAKSMSPYMRTAEEAESFVASLIMTGDLEATLSHAKNDCGSTMLHFSAETPRPSAQRGACVFAQLTEGNQLLQMLMNSIQWSNHALELSADHVDYLKRSQRRAEAFKKRGSLDDEDIMGDVH